MLAEDRLCGRFDYLFERLDVEESADDSADTDAAASMSCADGRPARTGAPVRMDFAAFILATLGLIAAAATWTAAPRDTQGGVANSPSTRAPISVAPEAHAPFPNQEPPRDAAGGGLLGGGLLSPLR